jgi:hypothetical protein
MSKKNEKIKQNQDKKITYQKIDFELPKIKHLKLKILANQNQ